MYYNAYKKDIAIVNIFFGEPTVYSELQAHFENFKNDFNEKMYFQNMQGCQRWLGWTSSPALAAFVDFVLESALCPWLKLSTGSLSDFAARSELEHNFL